MALDRQVNIYSVDTSVFYDFYERYYTARKYKTGVYAQIKRNEALLTRLTRILNKFKREMKGISWHEYTDIQKTKYKRISSMVNRAKSNINDIYGKSLNRMTKETKFLLVGGEIKYNKNIICTQDGILSNKRNSIYATRNINKDYVSEKDGISIFESSLTRLIGLECGKTISDALFVIRVFYFEILKDLMDNGFEYNGEKYRFFSCSAGQIRQKKAVFIKQSLYEKHEKTIMCGLTMDEINRQGGMNENKFMAYTSLISSATETWDDFDIDKSIVVDDFETDFVDYVDYITYQEEEIDGKVYPPFSIVRRKMPVKIPHTDGFGIMLDGNNTMVRLPFVKGLMGVTPFDKFIREHSKKKAYRNCGIVKDIYGKEHDILKEDIRYIFTKSQFKMWKYYDSWDQYKEYFKLYGCEACKCNEEEDEIKEAKINYQMLQTLTDMTDEELTILSEKTNNEILNATRDRDTMLEIMGVTKDAPLNTYLQKALSIYPELLNDTHVKDTIKQVKASLVKQARSGRLKINGKYTFVCPDTYAFMQWLFLKDENPKGLLDTGEVSCSLFKDGKELDCLRSPHLYIEHSIRKNVVNKEIKRWYKSNSIYTSTRDMISKILQFDCDGDKLLVVDDDLIVNVAKRNISKYSVVPLFYNMKKAGCKQLNSETLYEGLKSAYVGGNIGIDSNKISKLLNNITRISDDMTQEEKQFYDSKNKEIIKCVKLLCMHNNFEIDYAKTLFSIVFTEEIEEIIKRYTKQKLPHFFKYAKDKKETSDENSQVEPINNSTVNRLYYIVKNPKLVFKATNIGNYDYTKLMRNKDIKIDYDVIERLTELKNEKRKIMKETRDSGKYITHYVDHYIRKELLKLKYSKYDVADMILKYYIESNAVNKNILWDSFGDVIYENLKNNIPNNTKLCDICGERFEYIKKVGKPEIYCGKCKREKELEKYAKYNKNRW